MTENKVIPENLSFCSLTKRNLPLTINPACDQSQLSKTLCCDWSVIITTIKFKLKLLSVKFVLLYKIMNFQLH